MDQDQSFTNPSINTLALLNKLDKLAFIRKQIIHTIKTGSLNLSINATQEHVLMTIFKTPNTTMTELSILVGLEKSSLTRVIDALEREGLVHREYSSEDRRAIQCVLTEKGERISNQIDQIMETHLKDLLGEISADEIEALNQCLGNAVDLLSKLKK